MGTYLNEAKIFIKNLIEWIILLLIFTIFFFTFGLQEVTVFGKTFLFTLPTLQSGATFATQLFNYMTTDLIPSGVTLIVTNPLTAFIAQVKIALLLSFAFTLPFLLFRLMRYFSPALYKKEKISMLKVALPSALLFILGSLFAYLVLIPPTFSILYSYTDTIGAAPFFTVNEFVSLVLALVMATGIMFLLPVFMTLLSRFGLVPRDFWRENWRYALLIFLIVSAIITPDGSGVTMVLLSVPMAGLYGIGYLASQRPKTGNRKNEGGRTPS
ncbi:twin-arginine translocase subunit TatC [candidate division KSB1 bacterium]